MEISSLSYKFNVKNNSLNNNKAKLAPEANYSNSQNIGQVSYPKNYYLSFCGGKSLDLEKTYGQIKQFSNFPPNVEEKVEEIIQASNPENLTLVDIHKENYADLVACDNLEELKFFFPEFKDVLSTNEVDYPANSFIDKFENGLFKDENGEYILNPKKDLTLQLVQMYYGDCLSLTDLEKLLGTSPYAVMKKLNIPILDKTYGQYLKLSDAEKNTAITNAISRNNRDKAVSDATKAKISSGLKKYYDENPDIVFNRTSTHNGKLNDPIKSATFTQVLERAWGYHETKSLKKALSKFMKKKELSTEEFVEMTTNVNSNALKEFWSKNKWAREKFSVCMEKSWKRQKELERIGQVTEPICSIRYLPSQLKEEFIKIDPTFGELFFDRQQYAIYNKTPVVIPKNEKLEERSISVYKQVVTDNKENDDKIDLAQAQGCLRFYNEAIKSVNPETARAMTKVIHSYIADGLDTFTLFRELVKVNGCPSKLKEKISTYIDEAWEDDAKHNQEKLDRVCKDTLQNMEKYLTDKEKMEIKAVTQASALTNIIRKIVL